jgi:hypothetical protein
MEATCSSETSVDYQRTTRHYNPEDRSLHNHRCENLKSKIIVSIKVSRLHQEAATLVYPENVCGSQSQQATAEIGPSENPRFLHAMSLPTHHA